jgi:pseudaminic acid synthase
VAESITINGRPIGPGRSTYLIAEMSANHGQDFDQAVRILQAAKDAGADAIKIQTYTPDTLTLDCSTSPFQIKGTQWDGCTLHELYGTAYMPWEWQPRLKRVADELNLDLISTAYDFTSVDFLDKMGVPAYKIASFELVDLPLLRYVASMGKPILLSTGMATLAEIEEAVETIRDSGGKDFMLLKCTSAYPALPREMNLNTLVDMRQRFGVPIGLSDHSLNPEIALAAVALGASVIEKHFTLSRDVKGPDSAFSLEPDEFRQLVKSIRTVEEALGASEYKTTEQEARYIVFRRSLFVTKDVKAGDRITRENIRSIRPGYGLPPKYLEKLVGCRFAKDIPRGTPLDWDLIDAEEHQTGES